MRSDLSVHQRRMLARAVRGQRLELGSSSSMTTYSSLRKRGLLQTTHGGQEDATEAGRLTMPLDLVERELVDPEVGAGAMTTLGGIRVRLSQHGFPLAKRAAERAVLNALLVLEEEGKVRGYNLERSRFDVPAAGDEEHSVPIGDAYWVALVTPAREEANRV